VLLDISVNRCRRQRKSRLLHHLVNATAFFWYW